jgi:dGTPase
VSTREPTPSERATDDPAQQRWVAEPAKRAGRSAYQRDRARVLHSSALRRLAGKTQVVVPGEADFPRTRLTHSLECAQIGRELGAALGADPDLVETACLAHDLGHPPFGHTGESALDEVAADAGGFEGNAQSLRILTRLEAKAFAPDGRSVGLNLTRASLDAACKYPWPRGAQSRKYGVYDDDLDVFRWLRTGAPEGRLCLEAQVMDWSDDIAYSVHDLEDAVEAGHLDLDSLRDRSDRGVLVELTRTRVPGIEPAEVEEALDRLLGMPWWPASYDGSHRALAGLKNMTSQLIGRFAQAAEQATRETAGPGPLTRYAADLVVPRAARVEVETLKAVADRYVMSRDDATKRYGEQRTLVRELAEALLGDGDRAPSEVRAVVDRIAQLTDASATALHARVTAP